MPDGGSKSERRPRPAFVVDPKWRWVASLLGFLGLGVGGYATFTTDVEGGPVAILIIGLVFTFIGMRGELPNQVKIGENSMIWSERATEAVEDYVADTIAKAPPEEKAAEKQRAAELAGVIPGIAAQAITKAALRDAAGDFVRGAATSLPGVTVTELATPLNGRQLLKVEGYGGGKVLVDILPPEYPFLEIGTPYGGPDGWSVLVVGINQSPQIDLGNEDEHIAGFVYRPDHKFNRDAFISTLEDLLERSRALQLDPSDESED